MTASGIVLIDKPQGLTSHDVVARMRRRLGTRRVGHAGTLDPMATGLLVVLFGEATKLEPYLSLADKTYEARVTFGRSTDTLDAEGATVEQAAPNAELLREVARLARDLEADAPLVRAAIAAERARERQIPPAFSAIKVDGVRSHRLARRGQASELPSRPVTAHAIALTAAELGEEPSLSFSLTVTKGYYVRSFARDLGEAVGCPAHLSQLRRTRAGHLSIGHAVGLDAPDDALARATVELVEAACGALPALALDVDEEICARHGKPLTIDPARAPNAGPFALITKTGQRLVAIAHAIDGKLVVARGFT